MEMIGLILFPLVAALALNWVKGLNTDRRIRNLFVGCVLVLQCVLCAWTVLQGDRQVVLLQLTDQLPLVLQSDALARFFLLLFNIMWTVSAVFSFEYMKKEENEKRYYVFYLLTLSALCALAISGNMVTMYLFFEMMTLLSVALVLHEMSKEAIAGGMKYLLYSIAGATMGLLGIFFFTPLSAPIFTPGGSLDLTQATVGVPALLAILFVTVLGFSTKAGMFPMHAWLPTAHPIAPAPASAVLSGVITKAGVLCIIRIIYYVVGVDFLRGTWVQYALLTLALITIFMGSMMAFKSDLLKKRLAYSTVSQVSYILLGLFLLNRDAFMGSMLHIVFHSCIKITLFLSAGAIIYQTGKTKVSQLRGIGKEMPCVIWCFTLVSIGLIGIPPTGGFVSKWNLAQGALSSGTGVIEWLAPVVLLLSALLTAGYLLPVTIHGFFPGRDYDYDTFEKKEPSCLMLLPLILCTIPVYILGMFPGGLAAFIASIAENLL